MQAEQPWSRLADRLNISGLTTDLLRQALSHPSYVQEGGGSPQESNQRLEFLGDAVLDGIVAAELYRGFPDKAEGWLTRAKSAVVGGANLADVARDLGLGQYLLLGRGEENSGGRLKTSVLADTLEALVGAIYLSAGWPAAREFALTHLLNIIDQVEQHSFRDAKTSLQELLQAHTQDTPEYITVDSSGPAHNPVFEVEVRFAGNIVGWGRGGNKQKAEQAAARTALANKDQWLPELESD